MKENHAENHVLMNVTNEKSFIPDKCKLRVRADFDLLEPNQDKEVEIVKKMKYEEYAKDAKMDDSENNEDSMDDSGSAESSISGSDVEMDTEVRLTDSQIEELVAEFLEVESKAAEAQESLEKESLARVENEVREELAQSFHGDALELAVFSEMKTFKEEWESMLDDLETHCSLLLEQLDGVGIELPALYKWIESQAPNGCCTEAWKKRTHWVGSQVTNELTQSVKEAEDYLQNLRPVRRKHGKLLEEGASGFLAKKISIKDDHCLTENIDANWSPFTEIVQSGSCLGNDSFGSKKWASVYLANTPQEAANLGLMLPGIDEVEEIDELDCNFSNPFYADAVANEKDACILKEQKINFKKIREEDDASLTRKLQLQSKRQRHKLLRHEEANEENTSDDFINVNEINNSKSDCSLSGEDKMDKHGVNKNSKHLHVNDDIETGNERSKTVIIDSSDEENLLNVRSSDSDVQNTNLNSPSMGKSVNIIDVDTPPSSTKQSTCRGDEKQFRCTACSVLLKAYEVNKHPELHVIVCESCRCIVEEKLKLKDSGSEDFCRWCAKLKHLLSCKSCNMQFCSICISRNFDEKIIAEAKASGWQCCYCSPAMLHQLMSDYNSALYEDARGGLDTSSSESSDSEIKFINATYIHGYKKGRKKRMRRILDDAELGEETKEKIAIEKARQEHINSMKEQSASKSRRKNITSPTGNAAIDTTELLGDATEGYIVNVAREEAEDPARIPPSISSKLKPHQVAGIRFMWENIIQSVRKVKSGDKGLGCILAHTMGLGKTFQVIAFLYTAMRSVDLGIKSALIVTPVNVLHNWKYEFLKWKPVELKPLRILLLDDVPRDQRANYIARWRDKGGILLLGYASFRSLSLGKNAAPETCHMLQYGPDILICDEAHMIKNARADITLALKQVKTQRRIALTGSPLQNNLMEYYCMVDFVREGFLGSSLEFRNRFQNPIENGQHTNSTTEDVKLMNERSHILYEQLKGFVQRMDMNVVKNDLPPKTVFVIKVKLSSMQRKLYRKCLEKRGLTNENSEKAVKRCFFSCYQILSQILNHPGLLQLAKEQRYNLKREDGVENFLVDDSYSDDNLDDNELHNRGYTENQRLNQENICRKNDAIFNSEEDYWWEDLLVEKVYDDANYSGKMVLLLDILSMSSEAGDKTLVFSQSLNMLDIIEKFLSKLSRGDNNDKHWKQGKDWYRIDGSTDGSERQKLVEKFNEPTNTRVKCILISTKAGSLGINLYAANRVVLVDGSWNPTYDLQAIFRAWRYGQNKPVYAYRLMAQGTMEEKIYKRQVTKEGLAARVVDRQQIYRTMSKEDVRHIFEFGTEENADMLGKNQENIASSSQVRSASAPFSGSSNTPSDIIMQNLLKNHSSWITSYHEHETLLQENEAERLTKEEQDMAWQCFQKSKENGEAIKMTKMPSTRPNDKNAPKQTKASSKNKAVHPRKCNNLGHMLTLRSQNIKAGGSIVCKECLQEISWENLNRDTKVKQNKIE